LTTFANQAAIAIENARLYENLKAERDHLVVVEEEVRKRLAADLHDGPTQLVASLVMSLGFTKELLNRSPDLAEAEINESLDVANKTLKQLRTLLFDLRPVILETQGLVPALELYAERLEETEELNITLRVHNEFDGLAHKVMPAKLYNLDIREKLALTEGYEGPLLALKKLAGCRECYLLSTCNRVEYLLVAEQSDTFEQQVLHHIFGDLAGSKKCRDYVYIYYDQDAVHHLFMVAASLDSMIVGESQILGQLKEAYRYASGSACTGALLNKLLHKSFSVAKRVRSETGIGSSAVSISYAAVQLAKKIFGSLGEKKVMLIGAGEMAELAAEHLVGQGVSKVIVANRTLSRAVDLAQKFNGDAVSLEEIGVQLEHVDIIISSTGAKGIVLSKEDVRGKMRQRRNRPLFFIDIAVPRDLDPKLAELENIFLYDIDDLTNVVEMNRSEREKEAVKARRIVDEEALKFQRWRDGMTITPTIQAMRQKVDSICMEELDRTCSKIPQLTDKEREKLEKMVKTIATKVLHDPLQYLKNDDCERSNHKKIYNLRNIFRLQDGDKK